MDNKYKSAEPYAAKLKFKDAQILARNFSKEQAKTALQMREDGIPELVFTAYLSLQDEKLKQHLLKMTESNNKSNMNKIQEQKIRSIIIEEITAHRISEGSMNPKPIEAIVAEADLYGMEIVHTMLKDNGYNMISMAGKTIPTPGSPTFIFQGDGARVSMKPDFYKMKVDKIVIHKNDEVTVKTDKGYFKYSN